MTEPAEFITSGATCLICGKPVPDYEPQYCCSGHECGCMGKPIEPCVCSKECDAAMFDINGTFEDRRIRHNIELWKP
jgi:hypothetical protein